MRYVVTEYTPEGYAANTYHDTEEDARAALTTTVKRYESRPILDPIQFKIWQSTNRGTAQRTITRYTVPGGATLAEYNAYLDTLSRN